MSEISILYVTFPDEETASSIGNTLLDLRLIACINFFPIQSMYIWMEKKETGKEIIGLLKTTPLLIDLCVSKIKEIHPYEVPCILHKPWSANDAYFEWVNKVTSP
ncbi:MAG: divalent-cation tolerance protein CutA [Saprospiraceae bacterium]|nr:divalent-cation tolerance protein CutA [Saprospiraceae bacterium]